MGHARTLLTKSNSADPRVVMLSTHSSSSFVPISLGPLRIPFLYPGPTRMHFGWRSQLARSSFCSCLRYVLGFLGLRRSIFHLLLVGAGQKLEYR